MRVALPLLLAACIGDEPAKGKKEPSNSEQTHVSIEHRSDQTNNSGRLKVEVSVPEGATSMQITGESGQYVSFEELIDPDGERVLYWEDWYFGPRSLTSAIYGYDTVTALSWPPRDVDEPLRAGTWTAWLGVTNSNYVYQPGEPVDIAIATKNDDDFADGRVSVRILYADSLKRDDTLAAAIEQAVERWRTVWGDAGIELVERYEASSLDPLLRFAYTGSDDVDEISADKDEDELQLIIGESVNGDEYTLGVSAGIPGTIEPTSRTFVVLSWLSHAGPDGVFDDDEMRLMGETMAHEMGHYTGLFHPVEIGYDAWDALDDTTECKNIQACEDDLGRNLMYPYSICDFNSCTPQGQLSDQQHAVMNQYIGSL